MSGGLRLVTNTTSRPRPRSLSTCTELGFEVALGGDPASMAERHCRERGHRSVALLASAGLGEDFGRRSRVAPLGPATVVGRAGGLGTRTSRRPF
jgi:hypothetical protein